MAFPNAFRAALTRALLENGPAAGLIRGRGVGCRRAVRRDLPLGALVLAELAHRDGSARRFRRRLRERVLPAGRVRGGGVALVALRRAGGRRGGGRGRR